VIRGPLHHAGADGHCETCGEAWPCPERLAIFDQVVTRQRDANPPLTVTRRGLNRSVRWSRPRRSTG
jgi:hypothetical protein